MEASILVISSIHFYQNHIFVVGIDDIYEFRGYKTELRDYHLYLINNTRNIEKNSKIVQNNCN